ncbi:MAG TPA: type II toxin-antitoxin system RelE/ParE family toxin [Streptosporangiaceae bacterium]
MSNGFPASASSQPAASSATSPGPHTSSPATPSYSRPSPRRAGWPALKSCPSGLVRVARRKLDQLNQAVTSGDLRAPPSNHLEKLKGEREGQYSIRINDQWRVCFRWTESGAEDVEVADYH